MTTKKSRLKTNQPTGFSKTRKYNHYFFLLLFDLNHGSRSAKQLWTFTTQWGLPIHLTYMASQKAPLFRFLSSVDTFSYTTQIHVTVTKSVLYIVSTSVSVRINYTDISRAVILVQSVSQSSKRFVHCVNLCQCTYQLYRHLTCRDVSAVSGTAPKKSRFVAVVIVYSCCCCCCFVVAADVVVITINSVGSALTKKTQP